MRARVRVRVCVREGEREKERRSKWWKVNVCVRTLMWREEKERKRFSYTEWTCTSKVCEMASEETGTAVDGLRRGLRVSNLSMPIGSGCMSEESVVVRSRG